MSTDVCAALTGRQLEFCPRQSLYFYVNIVARRLEQVPAGNLSEEHATRRVGMCLSSVGSSRLTTLHDFPLFSPQPWNIRSSAFNPRFPEKSSATGDVYGLAGWCL